MPPRKPKRRALDAHLDGLSAEEKAAILASLEDSIGSRHARDNKDETETPGDSADEAEDAEGKTEPVALSPEVEARRRILRTSWRMAAFSQFSSAFPQLALKTFDIDKLEKELEGSEEGTYTMEVVSRLLYTLTRDSRLAGKSPHRPWVFSLRREFLRRDPEHNRLGDEPEWDYGNVTNGQATETTQTPAVDQEVSIKVEESLPDGAAAEEAEEAKEKPLIEIQETKPAPSEELKPSETERQHGQALVEDNDETAANSDNDESLDLSERYSTKAWDELSLENKIHALWSLCEWHLQNADKFRLALSKTRSNEEDAVTWRVEPIGSDSQHNTYWLFDDNRLWIERETPYKREIRIVTEEANKKRQEKQAARAKRIKRDRKLRMKALHQARRERAIARQAAEEQKRIERAEAKARMESALASLDEDLPPITNTRKRKKAESDEEDFTDDAGTSMNLRTSARVAKTRVAALATRRRSARNSGTLSRASSAIAMDMDGDDDWQKVPAEWLKSEDQEKDEDPDFGMNGDGDAIDDGSDAESDLSDLEDEEELPPKRKSQRSSPRKRAVKRKDEDVDMEMEESDLSELSDDDDVDDDDDNDNDSESQADEAATQNDTFPDSAYNLGPSFDEEDKDLPENFVKWEAICTNIDDWITFGTRFPEDTANAAEKALVNYVEQSILPGVKAALEAREAEKRKKQAAERAAAKKARFEKQPTPVGLTILPGRSGGRSSRIAMKESLAEEERRKAAALERVKYDERMAAAALEQGARASSETAAEHRAAEVDRRAQRAKQREEEKRAREEAEVLRALRIANGEPEEEEVKAPTPPAKQSSSQSKKNGKAGNTVEEAAPLEAEAVETFEETVPPEEPEDNSGDFFLDCSICKRRGTNLDANARLVQCDSCDRWEHIKCHNRAAAAKGEPKPDFENDGFSCEDCATFGDSSVIVPTAPKRERSDAQKAGAKRGAEKRKAKAAALRAKNQTVPPLKPAPAPNTASSPSVPASTHKPNGQGQGRARPALLESDTAREERWHAERLAVKEMVAQGVPITLPLPVEGYLGQGDQIFTLVPEFYTALQEHATSMARSVRPPIIHHLQDTRLVTAIIPELHPQAVQELYQRAYQAVRNSKPSGPNTQSMNAADLHRVHNAVPISTPGDIPVNPHLVSRQHILSVVGTPTAPLPAPSNVQNVSQPASGSLSHSYTPLPLDFLQAYSPQQQPHAHHLSAAPHLQQSQPLPQWSVQSPALPHAQHPHQHSVQQAPSPSLPNPPTYQTQPL